MKLSIITVNLNNREGLRRTIDSVVAQTWHDFEWIVIDGGSTDGSRELIEQYASHFAHWVSEPDSGIYNAMNKGIRMAQGEYCLFLNSGDWLCQEHVLYHIFASPHSADILYGYMLRGDPDGQPTNLTKSKLFWEDFIANTLPHQASFIRRSLFDTFGLYDETYKIAADMKFFVKAIVWGKSSYEFIPIKVSVFEGNGISDGAARFEERDVRLHNEMFPKMVLDDYPLIVSLRQIREHTLLRKCYTILSSIASKLERKKK